MGDSKNVFLSGFCDEVSTSKCIDEQFAVFSALGLRYVTLRFVNVGTGVKNLMQLSDAELDIVCEKLADYGLQVSSVGSPIGKVKLFDIDDGTSNLFRPHDEYLAVEVRRAAEIATRLNTKLIRGFSFYHPCGTEAQNSVAIVVPLLRRIAQEFDNAGLTFGLEVEANLIGHSGALMAQLFERVKHSAMVLIFDGGNLVTQGFSREQIFEQWLQMKPGLGWIHVKDYHQPSSSQAGNVGRWIDEEALSEFVTPEMGDSGYADILADLARDYSAIESRIKQRDVPGVFLDLEPHLRGGGQFGGYSGPDGMGIALRSLCRLLDASNLSHQLRGFSDLK